MVKLPGASVANNTPVGSAGQGYDSLKKEIPDGKAGAIKRRLAKKKDSDSGRTN